MNGDFMDVLEQLKASGVEADVGMMANYFGVSEQEFVNQVVNDLKSGASDAEKSLQRISNRIEAMKEHAKPNLTLVSN